MKNLSRGVLSFMKNLSWGVLSFIKNLSRGVLSFMKNLSRGVLSFMKNLFRGGVRRLPDFCLAARPMPYFPRCPIFQDFQFKICNFFGSWILKMNNFRPFPPHIRLSMPLLPAWPGLNFPILALCILVQISLYICPNMCEYFSNSRCRFSNRISLIYCLKGFPLSGRKRRHRTIFTEAQLREVDGCL